MSKNITYLLGAGASANALPTINEINTRLVLFRDLLFRYISDKQRNLVNNDLHPAAHDLFASLEWVISNTGKHFTIDIFARKLFAISSKHPELRILKCVLSTFFVFEQITFPENEILRKEKEQIFRKQIPDKRYDNLVSSLIEDEINNSNILGNIKVLSWNYDSQFEYAYKEFWDFNYLYETHRQLQVIPGMWISEMRDKQEIDIDKFSLIHLNGLAGFNNIIGSTSSTLLDKFGSQKLTLEGVLPELIIFYDELIQSSKSSDDSATQYFNYSWEIKSSRHTFKSPLVQIALYNAERIAKITDVLVVIGYSFPLFNRSVDNLIISKMENLSKVYIQDLNPEMIKDVMINSFSLLQEETQYGYPKIDFVLSKNVDQFVLPYEI